jgi:hypothetical protein
MLNHNVSPHCGENTYKYIQSQEPALNAAESLRIIYPQPPRLYNEDNISKEEV